MDEIARESAKSEVVQDPRRVRVGVSDSDSFVVGLENGKNAGKRGAVCVCVCVCVETIMSAGSCVGLLSFSLRGVCAELREIHRIHLSELDERAESSVGR